MALAAGLIPGFKYRILKGTFADEVVTITSNVPFPDCQDVANTPKGEDSAHKLGLPHNCTDPEGLARKISTETESGDVLYILPRLLDDRPVVEPMFASTAVSSVLDNPAPVLVPMDTADLPAAVAATVPAGTQVMQFTPITDPMDSRLDHLRPSRAKVKRYQMREMANGMTDVEFLLTFTNDEYRNKNEDRPANVMLKGDTQSGKTFLVEVLAVKWADKMGLPKQMPIFTLSGSSGITDFDLFGQMTSYRDPFTGQDVLVWLPGLVELAAQCGGILYLDEINMFGERVTSSLHPMCDHRHQFINRNKAVYSNGAILPDVTKASFDLWIIGTYNEGYRGGGEMNEAFINRFRHIRWGYDKDIEAKLIDSPAIRLLGEALRTARAGNQLRTPVGTTALQRVEEDVRAFGIAMGMEVLTGMFKANEVAVVESIIEDRSILVMLQEEQRQEKANQAAQAPQVP